MGGRQILKARNAPEEGERTRFDDGLICMRIDKVNLE